jgi:hypothetical protein
MRITALSRELGESSNDQDASDDLPHSSSEQQANNNTGNNKCNSHKLDNAALRQLSQLYMIMSTKLRLSSLIDCRGGTDHCLSLALR